MEIEEYIKLIDDKYYEAKRNKISRFDILWGKWSREMNLEIKDRLQTKNAPETPRLKMVVFYWIIRSQLLENYYKHTIQGFLKRKKLNNEANAMKEMILTDNIPADYKFEEVAKVIMGSI